MKSRLFRFNMLDGSIKSLVASDFREAIQRLNCVEKAIICGMTSQPVTLGKITDGVVEA